MLVISLNCERIDKAGLPPEAHRAVNRVMYDMPEHESKLPCYIHELKIHLPRFLIKDADISPIKRQWYDTLLRMGGSYPICYGSLFSDVPTKPAYVHYCNSIDFAALIHDDYGKCFSRYIPGYSCGMLLNREHIDLLSPHDRMQIDADFHEVRTLENGNVYCQLTSDFSVMTHAENIRLRETFKPYLPSVHVEAIDRRAPPSLRLGCTPDEIKLSPRYPICFVV